MAKTFSHIGVAAYKGKIKFRFTMGRVDARLKTMAKEGFTQIEFHELPSVMTKEQALQTDIARDLATKHNLVTPSVADQGEAEAA